MAERESGGWNVALVGASTLQGKEIKSILVERSFPLHRLALIDAGEAQGQLTEIDGEPAIVHPISLDAFQEIDLAIFASSPSFTEQHWRQASESGCRIVDLSYFLEGEPQARLGAPLIALLGDEAGDDGPQKIAPGSTPGSIKVSAHPAALAIAGILTRLSRRSKVIRSAITICEPASEHGQAGVDELHRQTIQLLSFQELPKAVFDAQIAFNLLSRYGENSRSALRDAQERIRRHLKSLLPVHAAPPAVRLLQVPVFHGHSFNCWVEFREPLAAAEIESALDQKPYSVWRETDSQPDLVAAAGSDEILLGAVEPDPACAAGYWIWGVFDNLRIAALNAEQIAEQMFRESAGHASHQTSSSPAQPAPIRQ